jgi:hypothetical protein
MFQGDTRIFAASELAVVGINLTTDVKRALVTENYEIQEPLAYLPYYQLKSH